MGISTKGSNQVRSPGQMKIWVAMATIYVVWGSTYLAIRFAVKTIPPFYMASVRFLLAGTILFIFRLLAGDPLPSWREWRSAGVVGLFLLFGGNGGVVWAEQHVPSSLAALLVGTVPLWMVLMDSFKRGRRRPAWQVMTGVVVGFAGIALLFWPGQNNGQDLNTTGIFVLVVASVSWAFGSVYSRKAVLPSSPLQGTAMEMLIGGAALFLAGTITGEASQVNFNGISSSSLLGVGYLVIFGSLLGFVAYTWLLRVAPTSLVSTYAYVNPVVAIIVGYLFANETLAPRTLVAAAVILGSVVLISRAPKKREEVIRPVFVSSGDD